MSHVEEAEGGEKEKAEKIGVNEDFSGWLGNVARRVTDATGGNYILVGGTRYGLRLNQELAVTPVDRLPRFRWSVGYGANNKKVPSSPRSDKAEKLRELTKKLKGPSGSVLTARRPSLGDPPSMPSINLLTRSKKSPTSNFHSTSEEGQGKWRNNTSIKSLEKKRSKSSSPHKFNLSIFNRSESADSDHPVSDAIKERSTVIAIPSIDENLCIEKKPPQVKNETSEIVIPKAIYPTKKDNDDTQSGLLNDDVTSFGDLSENLNEEETRGYCWENASIKSENAALVINDSKLTISDDCQEPDIEQNNKHHSISTSCTNDCDTELQEIIVTPPAEELQPSPNRPISEAEPPLAENGTLTKTTASENPPSHQQQQQEAGKWRRYRGDTSKRRKGVYITQWPEPEDEERNKLSSQSNEEQEESVSATPSDLSDGETQSVKRYSKQSLQDPYSQMLKDELAKPRSNQETDLEDSVKPRRKISADLSLNASSTTLSISSTPQTCHQRTASSPSKLEGLPGPSPELLAELLKGSSERVSRVTSNDQNNTRTHVVVELYDTERSYVEALQTLVNKYLQPLRSPENASMIDSATVEEIFYQIPEILRHHELFLEELHKRLDTWELHQTIGDVFLEVFTKPSVLETYTLFLDNWNGAKNSIKTTSQSKPTFARFLETMEREHKGKLGLDQLLIKPVQKIPRYELLIQRLLKHTDPTHPDHELLTAAMKSIHELVVKINCTERECLEWEQQQSVLKEVQSIVEGLAGIVANDRTFIRHDLVGIASNQGTRKERALFLFSDLLVITSIKRRSGTIRKPMPNLSPNSLVGVLEANKYKLLMRIPLDDIEVSKAKDESLRRVAKEVDFLRDDWSTLAQMQELVENLHGPKQQLEEVVKDMLIQTQKQLTERNAAHSQLACLELTLNTQSGMEKISIMFVTPDKRSSWEENFNDAKQKLVATTDKRPCPEFAGSLPIQKTRSGLQFTCAAPTLINGGATDVWVCNSDGSVGQVCVLSFGPESPQVTSCTGICNSKILCISSIPACMNSSTLSSAFSSHKNGTEISLESTNASSRNIQLDSSSSDDSDSDDQTFTETTNASFGCDESSFDGSTIDEEVNTPTMWLGTEDGYVHIYNCSDNIKIRRNRVKLMHGSSIHCIIYLDDKVFVSLANGEVAVYCRDQAGGWNTIEPLHLVVGTVSSPVTEMANVSGKLWCATHNVIRVINTATLDIEHNFSVSTNNGRPITCIASSGGLGVWIALHNTAVLKLYNAGTCECIADVNIAPAVTTMLSNCDDIIRQHKAACLRVTALLACNELLWIGTSAGVLLTVPIPHIKPSTQRMSQTPSVTGIPYGHTGHVRFLTSVEIPYSPKSNPKVNRYSLKVDKIPQNNIEPRRVVIISGGDGYEDFRGSLTSAEVQAGREDSTNHLLLWEM